jgi:hypothetical protein
MRPCASFPPSSGPTAMPILCVEWLCFQERWNPEVAIIFFARRLATARLQLAAVMMTLIRIIRRCMRGRFAPTPALWGASSLNRPVRAMAVRKCSKCCQLFRAFLERALFVRGMMHPYFSVGPLTQREALVWLPRRAGSSGISWRIHYLVKKPEKAP